jgi:hypothetical protein
MAKQVIGIGSAANDGSGDALRDAFDKVNDNFTELYDGKVEPDSAFTGDLVFTEAADHASTPGAGFGYLWVKSDTPSSLIFTDDAGTDYDLTDAGGGAFEADANGLISASSAPVLDAASGDEVAYTFDYTTNKLAGNDTGLLINQTDTASPGTSLLADFQVGGTSRFSVNNDGDVAVVDHRGYGFETESDSTYFVFQAVGVSAGFALRDAGNKENIVLNRPSQQIEFRIAGNNQNFVFSSNLLEQRNSTNAQTFNIYNTYDGTNNEYLQIGFTSDVATISTVAEGTGTTRALSLPNASIFMANLPTSDPGVAGQLWADSGVVTVSAG